MLCVILNVEVFITSEEVYNVNVIKMWVVEIVGWVSIAIFMEKYWCLGCQSV